MINPYFKSAHSFGPDQNLYEKLIVESIKIHGRDMFYLPRELVAEDRLLGEDKISEFNEAIKLEFYIESVTGFEGQGDILSKFGLEIRDEIVICCAVSRFEAEVTRRNPEIKRPREGDLIQLPMEREGLFEITFVEDKKIFYQMGRLYLYDIRMKRFEVGGEKFDTGIETIDEYEDLFALNTAITLTAGTGNFTPGETVQSGSVLAEVAFWDATTKKLSLVKIRNGEFQANTPIIGQDSGANWQFDSATDVEENASQPSKQNDVLLDFDGDVLDNTETNPYTR